MKNGAILRFIPLLALTACVSSPQWWEQAETSEPVPFLREGERQAILQYEPMDWSLVEAPDVPEGFWKTGFTNFSGADNVEENIAGIFDPHVYEVEFYEDWRTIEPEEGLYNWKPIDDQIAIWASYGKKTAIRIVTASHNTLETPRWLHENYHVRKITDGIWTDFETLNREYLPLGKGELTKDRELVVTGIRSAFGEGAGDFLELKSGKVEANGMYALEFDYRSTGPGSYYAALVTEEGGPEETKIHTWDTDSAEKGTRFWTIYTGSFSDYRIVWGIREGSALAVDNINTYKQTYGIGQEVGYPDYFNPLFREKWSNFVAALGERYADNPYIDTVCVSGHGRYGELGIEGNKAGLHDGQWLAIGYNQEKYMDMVEDNIRLFKEHFPEKRLRMVAGGTVLPSWTDEHYIYYRGINVCAEQGVEFKINGMQEAFGVWNTNAFSYGANRYKHDPNTSISIETAGQYYRNDTGAPTVPTGHPLSALNRVIIDGMDNMYLYSHDAMADSVKKYLHYMGEQLGNEVLTQFYCRPGIFEESNSVAEELQRYNDVWFGVFHKQYPDEKGLPLQFVERTVLDGLPVIRSGNSVLDFELDARQRYNGLYGSTITVSYLDEGSDSFSIQVNDSVDAVELRTIGTVKKENSGEWKTVSFHDSDWVNSYRNYGPDIRTNILIDDEGDGAETVRLVEVNAVPAIEWAMKDVASNASTEKYVSLSGGESWDFVIDSDAPHSYMSIPLYQDNSHETNHVRLKLYRVEESGEELLSDRELWYARDGLEIHLPYKGEAGGKLYRLEVVDAEGVIGLYLGTDDNPAWTVKTYLKQDSRLSRSRKEGQFIYFDAHRPYFGIELKGVNPSQAAKITGDVEKLMAGSGQWMTVAEDLKAISYEGEISLPFEPQVEGAYRIRAAGEVITMIDSVEPESLVRRNEPKGAVDVSTGEDLFRWDGLALASRWTKNNLETVKAGADALEVAVEGIEPELISPRLDMEAGRNQWINFTLSNPGGSAMALLLWRAGDEDWDYARSILMPVIANDDTMRSYSYPLGDHPLWTGDVAEVKIRLADGGTNRGVLSVGSLAISDETVIYDAHYDGPADRLVNIATQKPAPVADGTTLADEFFASLATVMTMPDFYAEEGQYMEIRLKNGSDATLLDFGWNSADWLNGSYDYKSSYVTIELSSSDEEFKTYRVYPTTEEGWKGRINKLFFKFDNTETEPGILIDRITVAKGK